MKFSIFVLALFSVMSFAQKDKRPKVPKGLEVKIEAYRESCDCYGIVISEESAVGPNFAKAESVAVATNYPGGSLALKKTPKAMENKTLKLPKDLFLLTDQEMEQQDLL